MIRSQPQIYNTYKYCQSNLRRFPAYDAAEAELGSVCAWSTSVKSGVRGNKG